MVENIDLYKAIASREKRSRQEAERLLDAKSLELYEKTETVINSRDELAGLNSLLSNITSSSPDCIFTVSSDFLIQGVNRTAEEKTGLSEQQLLNVPIDNLFPNLSVELKNLRDGRFFLEKMKGVAPNGDIYPIEIKGKVGEIYQDVRYVLFTHDISQREQSERQAKLIEQQVNEARRLEAIGTLSAGIAHEINTPIQFIGDNLGFLIQALTKIRESHQKYEHLAISVSGDTKYTSEYLEIQKFNDEINLQTLIKDIEDSVVESLGGIKQVRDIVLLMKEFSHPGSLDDQPTDINKLISDVIKICRSRAKGITRIVTNFDEQLPEVACRRGQIQQVIINLLINAIDAVDEMQSGDVCVDIATTFSDENIYIDISDTGRGIPDEICSKIFDPFFTTKPVGKGTGQGLALAKNFIVNVHQGNLNIVKRKGFATTFRIELPRINPKALSEKEMENEQAA